jgi:hypothetical protein
MVGRHWVCAMGVAWQNDRQSALHRSARRGGHTHLGLDPAKHNGLHATIEQRRPEIGVNKPVIGALADHQLPRLRREDKIPSVRTRLVGGANGPVILELDDQHPGGACAFKKVVKEKFAPACDAYAGDRGPPLCG